jgi:FAD/FMN-containing dehydrogenase
MRKMNSVVVNDATSSVTVDGGCLWGDVYAAMRGSERVCIGGSVHVVGVGGHLTGGE